MKTRLSVAIATSMLLAAPVAMAGAGQINTTVVTVTPNVTYSAAASGTTPALKTLIIYTVSVSSDPANTNTINNVRFTGTATATAGTSEPVVFDSAVGASCVTTNAQQSAIECAIGQLRAGQTYPTFTLFFRGPAKATTLPDGVDGQCSTTDCVSFAGTTFYAEGTGGLDTSVPQNSTVAWSASANVTLGTSNPTRVKSGLGQAGGKLFTGGGGVPTSINKLAMVSDVPALSTTTYTTADLLITKQLATDTSGTCGNAGNLNECPTFSVNIPGDFPVAPYLTNTYRVDATNLRKSGSQVLNNALIYYRSTESGPETLVNACTNGAPAGNGIPCVLDKKCYKKNVGGGLGEDCEWVLINNKNGFTRIE